MPIAVQGEYHPAVELALLTALAELVELVLLELFQGMLAAVSLTSFEPAEPKPELLPDLCYPV